MRAFLKCVVWMILAPVCVTGHTQSAPAISESDYVGVLRATRFVESYQEMSRAVVARGDESDPDFARVMERISKADLSGADSCVTHVYRLQDFTGAELQELTAFFTSPLGQKLLSAAQQVMLSSVESRSESPRAPVQFTDDEKTALAGMQKETAFRKYADMTANPAASRAMSLCIARAAGVPQSDLQ